MSKAVLFWSTGKDSAWALHRCGRAFDVIGLVTTVNRPDHVVAVHRISETLLDAQARALGLTLVKIELPALCSNSDYEAAVGAAMMRLRSEGVESVLFGDLFLADIRAYREKLAAQWRLSAGFPLWGRDTRQLADEMLAAGLRAVVTVVDSEQLDPAFVGREYDADFLAALPPEVDPCGERGEFHTFACAGPMFDHPIGVRVAEVFRRGRFVYARLDGTVADFGRRGAS